MSSNDPIDVLSFGEALVDFLPSRLGVKLREVEHYTRCMGGAPANLAYGVARLGGRSALMGTVGEDEFGHYLRDALGRSGVDVRGVRMTSEARTGIVFIELDAQGERSFLFYRHPSADMTISPEDIDEDLIASSHIVHMGTNLMTQPGPRGATLKVLETAHSAGRLVSVDANIRHHHWPNRSDVRNTIFGMLERVDLLKTNEEESQFLFGDLSARDSFDRWLAPREITALLMTYGDGGAAVVTKDLEVRLPAPTVEVIDTTGAGDAFLAGSLRSLSMLLSERGPAPGAWVQGLRELDEAAWRKVLAVGNHMGSAVCTCFGATTAVPTADEVPWSALGF